MLAAGVPLIRSLRTISAGQKGRLQRAFSGVTEAIREGTPLTEALAMYPRVFAQLDVMIIGAAEESGNLSEAFDQLAQWCEFSKRIKSRIVSGLALPIFIIHLAAFLTPLPRLIFAGGGVEEYFRVALTWLAGPYIITALIIAVMRLTPHKGLLRRALERFSLQIPLLGKALYRLALSRYCRVFHMTTKAGMPVTVCADLAIKGTGMHVVADLFRPALASVKAGNPFSEGLSSKLPLEFIEPWKVGEETGRLDDMSKKLAEQNAEASEFWFKQFAFWFPRIVYIMLLLIMAYLVISSYAGRIDSMMNFEF